MTAPVRVRFAPSPTGPLHIGGARTALYNFLLAKSTGGSFILRIDDTDRERSTRESLEHLIEALRWLGLDWDEGPEKDGDYGPYFQSERLDGYQSRVDELVARGVAYPCFCTPEQVQAGRERMQAEHGKLMYDRRCRGLSEDERQQRVAAAEPHTVRFAIPDGSVVVDDQIKGKVEIDLGQIDDWVMLREDGSPLYNLCSTLDDHDMRITDIVRGEEHFMNAVKQQLLFEAFGYPVPRFAHLPLILGKDGKKLSKRMAQTDLLEYRRLGYPSPAVVNFFTLLGWGFDAERQVFTVEEAIARFRLRDVGKSGSILDDEKLNWMSGVYIRAMSRDDLLDGVAPFLVDAGLTTHERIAQSRAWFCNLISAFRERIRIYSELPDKVGYLLADDFEYEPKAEKNLRKAPETAEWLAAYKAALPGHGVPPSLPDREPAIDEVVQVAVDADEQRIRESDYSTPHELETKAREVAESLGIGFGKLVHPIRAALTGATGGPGLFDIVYLLGEQRVVARLDRALAVLGSA